MIEVFVPGEPKPQPRPRAFKTKAGHVRIYDPSTAEGWKGAIAWAVKEHMPEKPLEGPIRVDAVFVFPRPKNHWGTGRNAGKLKDWAPAYHTKKPDRDNLDKAVLDALTALGVFKDDAQVAAGTLIKRYANSSDEVGCSLRVGNLEGGEPGKKSNREES